MSKFYVYLHKRKDNGLVFYVGKGTASRHSVTHNRNKEWHLVVSEANGFTSEIIHSGLTSEKAEEIELALLLKPEKDWVLVNKKFSGVAVPLSKELFLEYFEYSDKSPSGLIWRKDIFCGQFFNVKTAAKDTTAGNKIYSKNKKPSAWQVCLNYKTYLVHRVIFTMLKTEIPKGSVVNHIDNDPFNNRLENLEVCSITENNRRTCQQAGKVRKDNKTGHCGIVLTKNSNGTYYYVAGHRTLDGKLLRKHFSVVKYGVIPSFYLACEWRKEQIRLLNEQGAGYTERHGT